MKIKNFFAAQVELEYSYCSKPSDFLGYFLQYLTVRSISSMHVLVLPITFSWALLADDIPCLLVAVHVYFPAIMPTQTT